MPPNDSVAVGRLIDSEHARDFTLRKPLSDSFGLDQLEHWDRRRVNLLE